MEAVHAACQTLLVATPAIERLHPGAGRSASLIVELLGCSVAYPLMRLQPHAALQEPKHPRPLPPAKQPSKGQDGPALPTKQQAGSSQQLAGSDLRTFMGNKTDCAALLGLLGMTAALAVGTALETRHTWLRQIWIAMLFGPLG